MNDIDRLYASARKMVPALRERQTEAASLGHLPEATVREMQDAGFFRIMQPARFGGYEMEPEVFFRVQMTLAEGCMSTAWVL
ncbi:MAG TPA: flavin-dependent monooxygenase, partial [Haliea salexigens]|nr:flavin-dependent monooxygenase [Haliea salexigens]